MTVPELRGWLLTQPRPASLKVITTDDRHHEVAVTAGVSWMAIAQSIGALEPALVEAYDTDLKLLRAVRPLEQHHGDGVSTNPAPLSLPAGTDPQSAMLLHFADLLAGAYRHSTDVAFERMIGLFEASNRRAESLERSLETTHKMMRRVVEQQLENAEPPAKEGDLLHEMVGGFLNAAQHNNSNGTPPNGKAG